MKDQTPPNRWFCYGICGCKEACEFQFFVPRRTELDGTVTPYEQTWLDKYEHAD